MTRRCSSPTPQTSAAAHLPRVADQRAPVAWFVLNFEANVEVDITGLDALEDPRVELNRQGIVLALARVKRDLLDALNAYGLTAAIGPDRVFPTLPTPTSRRTPTGLWRRSNGSSTRCRARSNSTCLNASRSSDSMCL
jgi:hypothetical protein